MFKFIVKSYSAILPEIELMIETDADIVCRDVLKEIEQKADVKFESEDSLAVNIINSVLLGKIYSKRWTLHNSIEKIPVKIKKKLDDIVTSGELHDKSAEKIVQEISDALNPKKKTLYSGIPSASAQRVAKTTLVHTYQEAVVQALINTDFKSKVMVRWVSALAPNTCELCEQRHNQLYEPLEVPLEHPNGQCELIIEIY